MIICEGCGLDFKPEDMEVVETEVNLRDGTTRFIRFDGRTCCDFWDDTEPGDWVPLASGEEVQLVLWRCTQCDGVYDHNLVKELVDTDEEDGRTTIVCSFCQRKEKGRFKPKGEAGNVPT